ncbi:MAG: hypothetical protein M1833_000209 [Piccolia ochrophora]|nr:MAG: hypothetical protein M1833_000209 [Piccolia ochrophora]
MDPFRRLGQIEIGLILHLLPAVDTERVRRVSRWWKALAEHLLTLRALRTEFPESNIARGGMVFGNRPEANLAYRRLLAQRENMKAGFVTRSTTVYAVVWDFRNEILAWMENQLDSVIRISDLKHGRGTVDELPLGEILRERSNFPDLPGCTEPFQSTHTCAYHREDWSDYGDKDACLDAVKYIRIIDSTPDVIVCVRAYYSPNTLLAFRISRQGVRWRQKIFLQEHHRNEVIIGKSSMFTIEQPSPLDKQVLVIRHLDTGVVKASSPIGEKQAPVHHDLLLSPNEQFLLWTDAYSAVMCASASNARVIDRYERPIDTVHRFLSTTPVLKPYGRYVMSAVQWRGDSSGFIVQRDDHAPITSKGKWIEEVPLDQAGNIGPTAFTWLHQLVHQVPVGKGNSSVTAYHDGLGLVFHVVRARMCRLLFSWLVRLGGSSGPGGEPEAHLRQFGEATVQTNSCRKRPLDNRRPLTFDIPYRSLGKLDIRVVNEQIVVAEFSWLAAERRQVNILNFAPEW